MALWILEEKMETCKVMEKQDSLRGAQWKNTPQAS